MTYIPVRGGDRAEARERLLSRRYDDRGADGRTLLGVLLGLAVFLLVGFYSLKQQASESSAQIVLESAVASTTDLETAVREALPAMREEAASGETNLIELPGFPVSVFLTRAEVLSLDEAEVHELLLSRAAAIVYLEGWSAFDQTGSGDLSLLSAEGLSYRILDRLDPSTERRARNASVFLAFVAAGLVVTVFALGDGYGRFRALGLPILFAAAPGVAGALFVKVLFKLFGNGDRFTEDLLAIVDAVANIPLRNYTVLAAFGGVVLAVGPLLRLIDSRLPAEAPDDDPRWLQRVAPRGPREPRPDLRREFEARPRREPRPDFEPRPRREPQPRQRPAPREYEAAPVHVDRGDDET